MIISMMMSLMSTMMIMIMVALLFLLKPFFTFAFFAANMMMNDDVDDYSEYLLFYSNCAYCYSDNPHLLELKRLLGMHCLHLNSNLHLFTFVIMFANGQQDREACIHQNG